MLIETSHNSDLVEAKTKFFLFWVLRTTDGKHKSKKAQTTKWERFIKAKTARLPKFSKIRFELARNKCAH